MNSGGVVFFALFNSSSNVLPKEAAAVIKFSSSKMSTQAERLGYEFARLLGVQTPQVFCKLPMNYAHFDYDVPQHLISYSGFSNNCRLEWYTILA